MFFERHLENIIEHFIPETTPLRIVSEEIPLCEAYVRRLDISQMLPPIKEAKIGKGDAVDWLSETDSDAAHMEHFDFRTLLNQLSCLEELHLTYWVKQCGMNFEWKMFEMAERDCETLAMALESCKTLKDGGKALEEAIAQNSCLTECDVRLTDIDEQSASIINQVVRANKSASLTRRVVRANGSASVINQAVCADEHLEQEQADEEEAQDDEGESQDGEGQPQDDEVQPEDNEVQEQDDEVQEQDDEGQEQDDKVQ
uniref:Uncharacterized protein n=1 Tax=Hippocampus comes TaxID=109280 RepID=A0A3Q2XUC6_HIPCM